MFGVKEKEQLVIESDVQGIVLVGIFRSVVNYQVEKQQSNGTKVIINKTKLQFENAGKSGAVIIHDVHISEKSSLKATEFESGKRYAVPVWVMSNPSRDGQKAFTNYYLR